MMIRAKATALIAGLLIVVGVAGLALTSQAGRADAQAATAPAGQPQHLATEALTIRSSKGVSRFTVQFADNEMTREIGLMFRPSMADDEGMIFDFHDLQPVAFWMRNTLIPLDIIYIAPNGRVLNIAARARPLDETPLPSAGPVRAVLEINGGLAAKLGIKPGDRVTDERIFRH